MDKRGISPLIASILLIGFTVALAAFIMTWGVDYFKDIMEKSKAQSDQALRCSSELNFEILAANCSSDSITIDNRGNIDITSLTFRTFVAGQDVTPFKTTGIPALGVKTFNITLAGVQKVQVLAAIPSESGSEIFCEQVRKEYATNC